MVTDSVHVRRGTLKFNVLVLGGRTRLENAEIVSFLSRGYGRLDAVAYESSKPSRSRRVWEPFQSGQLTAYRKKEEGLWTVRDYLPRKDAPSFRGDWRKSAVAEAGADLVVVTAPEEHMGAESYDIMDDFCRELHAGRDPLAVLMAFTFCYLAGEGFGGPEGTISARARSFLKRAGEGARGHWRRFRLETEVRKELPILAKKFVEEVSEREWKGLKIAVGMLESIPGS